MKILVGSHVFAPSVGGIEESSAILVRNWIDLGHEVHVVTQSSDPSDHRMPFPVFRNPTLRQLIRSLRWCDLFFQNNISLQSLWPALLMGCPTAITHQTWTSENQRAGLRGNLKIILSRMASRNIAISRAVADSLPYASDVIPNPYREDVFFERPAIARDRELVFVGRLVPDKGCDLLLESLAILQARGIKPNLTIIGSGSEEIRLRNLTLDSGLREQVVFEGRRSGEELSSILNRHRILIVPSRWKEPFGIVALESIASGCVVIGSSGGGLSDAIGSCGQLFPSGDASALAREIERLLINDDPVNRMRACSVKHLASHRGSHVALEYLRIFDEITG